MSSTEYVEVGDTIISTSFLGESHFPASRVTKTLAISKRESDGYEHRFQRYISSDMSYPQGKWNSVKYRVVRKEIEA